jgi:hypothetical protein
MAYRQLAYLPDRRSTRIEQSVHITIRGLDASRSPYEEKAATLSVNCHGCRYLSRNNVLRGDNATLEVGQLSDGRPRYSTQARVISVKRLGPDEELFDVAVELESPRNIWGIASPPEDWPPVPEVAEPIGSARELHIVRREAPGLPESGALSSLPPLLVQVMASLHERMGASLSEAAEAAAATARDDGRSLSEFRGRLENEAAKVLERVVTASMEDLARRAQKLRDSHEAALRSTCELWLRKFQQELANPGRLPGSSSMTNERRDAAS